MAKGHKRIGFIGAEGELNSNARDRLRGYREGLEETYERQIRELVKE